MQLQPSFRKAVIAMGHTALDAKHQELKMELSRMADGASQGQDLKYSFAKVGLMVNFAEVPRGGHTCISRCQTHS